MSRPFTNSEEQSRPTLYRAAAARRFRMVGPVASYRTKDDADPVGPLPRWTSWVMIGWMIGAAATYSIILSRCWE
jgi:hypothetical protein